MAKKRDHARKLFFVLFGILIVGIGIVALFQHYTAGKNNSTTSQSKISPETAMLANVAVWYPSAPWTTPAPITEETQYGNLSGESMQATITSDTPALTHFEMVPELTKMGYVADNMLAADGPGSSMWGYKKVTGGKTQILTFSYKTQPTNTNPNEPLEFNCPCKIDLSVFVSKPF